MVSTDKYIGMLLDNRYEILEKIGTGGMAVVYKARCHRLNRLVAIKILKEDLAGDEDFRRRFHTESQAVAMLSHPNIVAIYDVSHSDNLDYIVMELIDGITLKQYINRKGLLGWKESLHFVTQIIKALSHAHAKGIIHRDIKPHNIMILKDGSVKVADFGIARLISGQNTLTREALGSVHYISPEQAKGGHVDARSDLYSVGVVLYEMLTSRLPFVGDSAVSIAIQHISAIPLMPRDINPDIPPGLEDIAMHAMEPDVNTRYATADEMLFDLEEFRKNPAVTFNYVSPTAKPDGGDPLATRPVPSSAIAKTENAISPIKVSRAPKKPELTREEYRKTHKRATRTSLMIGVLVVIAFLIIVFLFMWKFFIGPWIDPVKPEMVATPSFIGQKYEAVIRNTDYRTEFNFENPVENYNDTVDEGVIYDQNPIPNRQSARPSDGSGIDVTLYVSLGPRPPVKMPDLLNQDYRAARSLLEDYQLELDIWPQGEPSDTVTPDMVFETIPAAGETLTKGKTVYIKYSTGPNVKMAEVPNVEGLKLSAAIMRLESYNLTYDTPEYIDDDAEKDTVVFQSVRAGEFVPEHTAIRIQVSNGPPPTPTPTETPTPTPTPSDPPPPDDTPPEWIPIGGGEIPDDDAYEPPA
jgi:serine/threonine-protein kinase